MNNATLPDLSKYFVVAVSGTRHGMTKTQLAAATKRVAFYAQQHPLWALGHGDCVGADEEFALMAAEASPKGFVFARPGVSLKGTINRLRSSNALSDYTFPSENFYRRNRRLIDGCDIVPKAMVLIATPRESSPQSSGGTWMTIKYGMVRCRVEVIGPDGSLMVLNGG